jgi:hypothetical protein
VDQVRKAALISIIDGKIVRNPGFLRIVEARVSVLHINLKQIGPEVCLESINGGASRWINGVRVKIGPETKVAAYSHHDLHREPPCVHVCDVV